MEPIREADVQTQPGKRLAENGYEVKTVIGGMHAYRGRYLVAGEEL